MIARIAPISVSLGSAHVLYYSPLHLYKLVAWVQSRNYVKPHSLLRMAATEQNYTSWITLNIFNTDHLDSVSFKVLKD
jgi:hypothetical protein